MQERELAEPLKESNQLSKLNSTVASDLIKELEAILKSRDYTKHHDYKFLVDENKKLHKEVDELKRDNKALAKQIDDYFNARLNKTREGGW